MSAQFYVLGPLEVRIDGEPVTIRSGRERALLATLLLRANRLVTLDELVENVWGEQLPDNPRATVQTLVMRLRKKLTSGQAVIHTHPGGYLATPPYLDLVAFRGRVAGADEASRAGDREREAAELRSGLGLRRGPTLANVPSEKLHRDVVPGLEEEYLAALARRIDADIEGGQASSVVAELRTLTAEHSLRERFWALLIRALSASGRRAEALDTFEAIRQRLIDELGVEPGEELRDLHRAVLADKTSDSRSAASRIVPRQLPPDVRAFTGRATELAALDARLAEHAQRDSTAVVITAIAGTAGVGKTALAAHWAWMVADRFPDGQLWINLRGYDPDQPVAPGQALMMFLRALGVPGTDIPLDLDAQVGLYRSLLAGRRVLVVLDNASDADQVRPLLPGASACFALVTSRDDLPGLVARDGATRIRLGVLSLADSVSLLRRLLAHRTTDVDDDAVEQLSELCARLPLALRVAADRLSTADASLREAVADLAVEPRLDALAAGNDPHTAARAVFSWSYERLPHDAAVLFRRLGLVPGADWDAYIAAALMDSSLPEAQRLLHILAAIHLIEERGSRFQMHDLLRAYSIEQTNSMDSEADRYSATTGMLDYYTGVTAAAMNLAFSSQRSRLPHVPAPATPSPAFTHLLQATRWLDDESRNIVAISHTAHEMWPTHIMHLAALLYRYLDVNSSYADAVIVHSHALQAARRTASKPGEVIALNHLGNTFSELSRYDDAISNLNLALVLAQDISDLAGQALALGSLGTAYRRQGRYDEAYDNQLLTLAIRREIADRTGEANALNNLGTISWRLGRYNESLVYLLEAMAVRREIEDQPALTSSLNNLGTLHASWGRPQEALDYYQQALRLARTGGNRSAEAYSLYGIGRTHAQSGHNTEALDYTQRALHIAFQIGKRTTQIDALITLGLVYRGLDDPSKAANQYGLALKLAREVGDPYEQARALDGIAHCSYDHGDNHRAHQYWTEALATFADLRVPETEEVRSHLTRLEQATP